MSKQKQSLHERRKAAMQQDPEYRAEYKRARREIAQVDSVVRELDELREAAGLSKAELARHIDRNPSSIRRLFTQRSNPELRLVAQIAEKLGADIRVVPRRSGSRKRSRKRRPAGGLDV